MAESNSKPTEEDEPKSTKNPFTNMGIDYEPIKLESNLDWLFRKN